MVSLVSRKDVRDACEAYFQATEGARITSEADFKSVAAGGWWMHGESVFRLTAATTSAATAMVKRVLKVTGSGILNESQIRQCAMEVAAAQGTPPDQAKILLSKLESASMVLHTRIEPCFAVSLVGIRSINIGKVRVRSSHDVAREFNGKDARFAIAADAGVGPNFENGVATLRLPRDAWQVEVRCARGVVPTEARWLIDVAMSLVRLLIPPRHRTGSFPPLGAMESATTAASAELELGLTAYPDGVSFGSAGLARWYEVSATTFSSSQRKRLNKLGLLVTSPPPNSLAERMSRSLGWLTQGRRSTDQATRFLCFFTAIEAILTRDDKSAPVTDTVCRSAACILAKSAKHRASIAKEVADLYEVRSKLVHAGDRRVTDLDSRDIQLRSELLIYTVLMRVDLAVTTDAFHTGLKVAGYGTRWPPATK